MKYMCSQFVGCLSVCVCVYICLCVLCQPSSSLMGKEECRIELGLCVCVHICVCVCAYVCACAHTCACCVCGITKVDIATEKYFASKAAVHTILPSVFARQVQGES